MITVISWLASRGLLNSWYHSYLLTSCVNSIAGHFLSWWLQIPYRIIRFGTLMWLAEVVCLSYVFKFRGGRILTLQTIVVFVHFVLWWKWVCKVVLANLQEWFHSWTLLCLSLTAQLFCRGYVTRRYVAYCCIVHLPSDGDGGLSWLVATFDRWILSRTGMICCYSCWSKSSWVSIVWLA